MVEMVLAFPQIGRVNAGKSYALQAPPTTSPHLAANGLQVLPPLQNLVDVLPVTGVSLLTTTCQYSRSQMNMGIWPIGGDKALS